MKRRFKGSGAVRANDAAGRTSRDHHLPTTVCVCVLCVTLPLHTLWYDVGANNSCVLLAVVLVVDRYMCVCARIIGAAGGYRTLSLHCLATVPDEDPNVNTCIITSNTRHLQ